MTDLTRGIYRRIYSGFIEGQRINKLSIQAEAWFWRILATTDDFGNAKAEPRTCWLATVGHRENVTTKHVAGWLQEMADAGLIVFYKAKGERFLHVTGFEETQPSGRNGKKIQRYPIPDESRIIQGNPELLSASDNHTDNHTQDDTEDMSRSATALAVFNFWRTESGKEKAQFTPKRRRRVVGRLNDGYTQEQIETGIRGCLSSPFHQGQNDTGEKYEDLELICRDGEHLEKFIAIQEEGLNGNGHKSNTASDRNVARIETCMDIIRQRSGEADHAKPVGWVAAPTHRS